MNKAKNLLRGAAFDPETVAVLVQAFESACKQMHDTGQPDIVYDIIAQRIIKLAEGGERNVDKLAEGALSPILGPR